MESKDPNRQEGCPCLIPNNFVTLMHFHFESSGPALVALELVAQFLYLSHFHFLQIFATAIQSQSIPFKSGSTLARKWGKKVSHFKVILKGTMIHLSNLIPKLHCPSMAAIRIVWGQDCLQMARGTQSSINTFLLHVRPTCTLTTKGSSLYLKPNYLKCTLLLTNLNATASLLHVC